MVQQTHKEPTVMTVQEMFDIAVTSIRIQGGPCRAPTGGSAYRSPDTGRRCPIGWLIPEDEYSPSMEGIILIYLLDRPDTPKSFMNLTREHRVLLQLLQLAHDSLLSQAPAAFMKGWEEAMKRVALREGLTLLPAE